MIEYSKEHKFTGCFVRVAAENGHVRLSAGATLTPEQALELVTSILVAREIIVALEAEDSQQEPEYEHPAADERDYVHGGRMKAGPSKSEAPC